MFKAGDRVERIDGDVFSNDAKIATVERVSGNKAWLLETGTYSDESYIKLAEENDIKTLIFQLKAKLLAKQAEVKKFENAIEAIELLEKEGLI